MPHESDSERRSLVGTVFADWQVISRLGAGGMGAVYRVRRGEQEAALKVLQPHYLSDERYRRRFMYECEQLQTLRHPNIVRLLQFGTHGEMPYLIMELIEGTDLHTIVEEQGPLPWFAATKMIATIARALEFARQRGLIHRDIKPENVLIARRGKFVRAKLVDFGLIKQIGTAHVDENLLRLLPEDWYRILHRFQDHLETAIRRKRSPGERDRQVQQVLRELRNLVYTAKPIQLPDEVTERVSRETRKLLPRAKTTTRTKALGITQYGECLGTPQFMAPETWLGLSADHRADIFALGVTWYFLMTARYPFDGETSTQVMDAAIGHVPDPVFAHMAEIPDDVWDVMLRMIAKLPEQRYPRYEPLIDDLERLIEGHVPQIDFMGEAVERAREKGPRLDAVAILYEVLQSFLEHAEIESQASAAVTTAEADTDAHGVGAGGGGNGRGDAVQWHDSFAGETVLGDVELQRGPAADPWWLIVTDKAARLYSAAVRPWFERPKWARAAGELPTAAMMVMPEFCLWRLDRQRLVFAGQIFTVPAADADRLHGILTAFGAAHIRTSDRPSDRSATVSEVGVTASGAYRHVPLPPPPAAAGPARSSARLPMIVVPTGNRSGAETTSDTALEPVAARQFPGDSVEELEFTLAGDYDVELFVDDVSGAVSTKRPPTDGSESEDEGEALPQVEPIDPTDLPAYEATISWPRPSPSPRVPTRPPVGSSTSASASASMSESSAASAASADTHHHRSDDANASDGSGGDDGGDDVGDDVGEDVGEAAVNSAELSLPGLSDTAFDYRLPPDLREALRRSSPKTAVPPPPPPPSPPRE